MDTVVINEVGLRDGLQNLPQCLNTDRKLEIFDALVRAGLRHLEVTSFVGAREVPQLADADQFVCRLPGEDGLALTALVPNQRGYERAKASGIKGIAVVLAATESLNRRNIGMSLARATEVCTAVVRQAKQDGRFARAYIAAALACPDEGPTPVEVVTALADRMVAAGADEVAIADTIGAGNPPGVKALMAPLIRDHGAGRIAAHFHDTRGLGSALAWVALECGVRRFDSAIAGLGGCPFAPGASGNLATEDLAFMLGDSGFATGVDFDALLQAVAVTQRIVGQASGGRILPWATGRNRSRATTSTEKAHAALPF